MQISVKGIDKSQLERGQAIMEDATLFFAKKSVSKSDQCAGAL
jgi:hypothetical protein